MLSTNSTITNSSLLTKDPTNQNKGMTVTYYDIENFTILITINKNDTVTVVVGCSENPVVLDFNGINRLSNALTRIEERLSNFLPPASNHNNKLDRITIPSHKGWTITLWHLGRDSIAEYSKEMFHCQWNIAEQVIELGNNKNASAMLSNTSSIHLSKLTIKTTTYGPDLSAPITGTYHIEGPILVEPNDYIVKVELISIDEKSLSKPIEDVFILPLKV